jgi:hypothetical protein
MGKLGAFLFGEKLSGSNDVLVVIVALESLGWLPSMGGLFFVENLWHFLVFVVIYVGIIFPLYIIIRKIIASKQGKMAVSVILICILLLIIQNGVMLYLYSFRVLVSAGSLWVTIPVSLIVTFCCVAWMRISNEHKNGVNH